MYKSTYYNYVLYLILSVQMLLNLRRVFSVQSLLSVYLSICSSPWGFLPPTDGFQRAQQVGVGRIYVVTYWEIHLYSLLLSCVVDSCFCFTVRAGQGLGVTGIEWQVESWYRVTADMEHTNTTVLSYIKCNFTCVTDTLLIHSHIFIGIRYQLFINKVRPTNTYCLHLSQKEYTPIL